MTVLYSETIFVYLFCNNVLEVWLFFCLFYCWYIWVCPCSANSLSKLYWLEIWLGQEIPNRGPCWSDWAPAFWVPWRTGQRFESQLSDQSPLWWPSVKGMKSIDSQRGLGSCRTKTFGFSWEEREVGEVCSPPPYCVHTVTVNNSFNFPLKKTRWGFFRQQRSL